MFALVATFLLAHVALSENVVTLTTANFDETINANEFVLAEFYAPWCGHCKSLAPEYEKAATALKENDATKNVILAKIDATEEKDLAEKFGISGFPTLKWFVNGKPSEYSGGRTSETIQTWIKKKTGPAVTVVSTVEALEALKKANEVVAVLSASAESAEFESAAKTMEIPFAACIKPSAELAAALGNKQDAIVVFKQFDELRAELPAAAATAAEIVTFVESHSLPLVVPFSQKTAPKIFGNQNIKQHFLVFVDKTDAAGSKTVVDEVSKVAKEFRGKYLFVSVDKAESRVTEFFGIATYPDARIVQMGEKGIKKFRLVGKLVEADIKATLEQHAAGTLQLDLKSEEVPATNDGDIKVVVGKNFNEIVKKPGQDVFVEFYAPWCGHCKALKPKYEELGKWAKDKKGLTIAMMDASMNEVAGVDISSFPTLKLFKADSDEVVDYEGEREVEAMIAFLEKEAASCKAE